MGVSSLPETITRQRRDCDLNPRPSALESSTPTTPRLPSQHCLLLILLCVKCRYLELGGVEQVDADGYRALVGDAEGRLSASESRPDRDVGPSRRQHVLHVVDDELEVVGRRVQVVLDVEDRPVDDVRVTAAPTHAHTISFFSTIIHMLQIK